MAPRDRVAPRISPPGSGAGRARWTPIRAALALPQFTASGARALPCNCTHMPAEKLRMCCAGGETGAFFFLVFQRSSRGGLRCAANKLTSCIRYLVRADFHAWCYKKYMHGSTTMKHMMKDFAQTNKYIAFILFQKNIAFIYAHLDVGGGKCKYPFAYT